MRKKKSSKNSGMRRIERELKRKKQQNDRLKNLIIFRKRDKIYYIRRQKI